MAELTNLEDKLAEVIGLAMAAKGATDKISGLVDDEKLSEALNRMHHEADETEERGLDVASTREGKKTAVLDKARETKKKAEEMLSTYLDEDADGLDGFEFLTMAEAGEVGHWKVLQQMSKTAGETQVIDLTEWALPIQERHLEDVQAAALKLAAQEDPSETS